MQTLGRFQLVTTLKQLCEKRARSQQAALHTYTLHVGYRFCLDSMCKLIFPEKSVSKRPHYNLS